MGAPAPGNHSTALWSSWSSSAKLPPHARGSTFHALEPTAPLRQGAGRDSPEGCSPSASFGLFSSAWGTLRSRAPFPSLILATGWCWCTDNWCWCTADALTGIPICTLQFVNSPTLYIPRIKEAPQELEEQELVLYNRRRHSIVILKNVIYFKYSDPWTISTEENTGPSCCRSCFRHVLHKYSEDVFGWQQLSSGIPGHTEAQLKAATSSSELIHCYGQNSTNRPNNWDVAIPISE